MAAAARALAACALVAAALAETTEGPAANANEEESAEAAYLAALESLRAAQSKAPGRLAKPRAPEKATSLPGVVVVAYGALALVAARCPRSAAASVEGQRLGGPLRLLLLWVPGLLAVSCAACGSAASFAEGWSGFDGIEYMLPPALGLEASRDGRPITAVGNVASVVNALSAMCVVTGATGLAARLAYVHPVLSCFAGTAPRVAVGVFAAAPALVVAAVAVLGGPVAIAEGWSYNEGILYAAGSVTGLRYSIAGEGLACRTPWGPVLHVLLLAAQLAVGGAVLALAAGQTGAPQKHAHAEGVEKVASEDSDEYRFTTATTLAFLNKAELLGREEHDRIEEEIAQASAALAVSQAALDAQGGDHEAERGRRVVERDALRKAAQDKVNAEIQESFNGALEDWRRSLEMWHKSLATAGEDRLEAHAQFAQIIQKLSESAFGAASPRLPDAWSELPPPDLPPELTPRPAASAELPAAAADEPPAAAASAELPSASAELPAAAAEEPPAAAVSAVLPAASAELPAAAVAAEEPAVAAVEPPAAPAEGAAATASAGSGAGAEAEASLEAAERPVPAASAGLPAAAAEDAASAAAGPPAANARVDAIAETAEAAMATMVT